MATRIPFCGSIVGSVVRRQGETNADAIARAEATINDILTRHALRLSTIENPGVGPGVGLEPDDSNDQYPHDD